MVRLARSQNLLALSPNRDQVARQPATEALPLVMEPESRFYGDPVVVLDFQSLYPSLVIAYNLCYSTCVGRPAHLAAALDAQAAAAAAAAERGAAAAAAAAAAAPPAGAAAAAPAPPPSSSAAASAHLRTSSSTKGGLRLGVSTYLPPTDAFLPGGPADLRTLVVAPNGVAFVPAGDGGCNGSGVGNGVGDGFDGVGGGDGGPASRGRHPGVPGVLPRMLHEILATRVMVKAALKRASKPTVATTAAGPGGGGGGGGSNRQQQKQQEQQQEQEQHLERQRARALQRRLNARQFGLKMIANVTYGYTSASFSGRMPCAELADAIVSTGRATLEAAVRLVEANGNWRAKVVYGDTDSLFVLLPGRSRADAFVVGAEIAAAVTAANPRPVRLRMDKVYHPCVLQTKKRYVGAMFERADQARFSFDAKGIETVRRDACPATSKMLEAALRVMFATGGDLSRVRRYCERQWAKILSGRVSVQDFVFWREVRGPGGYAGSGSALPPAAAVAADMARRDPRAEPRPGERVPYVVVCGPPGARLVELAVPPRALVESAWLALSAAGAGPPPLGYAIDGGGGHGHGGGGGGGGHGGGAHSSSAAWLSALGASAAGAAAGAGALRLNAGYYIARQIVPALERVLALAGADVRAWYAALPHASLSSSSSAAFGGGGGGGGPGFGLGFRGTGAAWGACCRRSGRPRCWPGWWRPGRGAGEAAAGEEAAGEAGAAAAVSRALRRSTPTTPRATASRATPSRAPTPPCATAAARRRRARPPRSRAGRPC